MQIDNNGLRWWLQPIDKIFKHFEKQTVDYNNRNKRHIFIDNGSDILLVAHVDTVLPPKFINNTKKRVYAQGLDDRLGCYIAFNLATELSVDLLLTDNEEICRTTAGHFTCKQYNWVAEFDRGGNDVVHYGLTSNKFNNALSEFWGVSYGSYSDVCELSTTACCVNIGIGYQYAHSEDSYATWKVARKQVELFRQFYNKNKDVVFVQDFTYDGNMSHGMYDLMDEYKPHDGLCELCGSEYVESVYGYNICEACFLDLIEKEIVATGGYAKY